MIKIAVDIDGTLYKESGEPNEILVKLIKACSKSEDFDVIIWSGGGKDYAETKARLAGINDTYNVTYLSKINNPGDVDIAIDDVSTAFLAKLNLIIGITRS